MLLNNNNKSTLVNKTKESPVDKVDFMEEVSGQGYESIGQEDISTPYLKVAQALSPELDKEEEAYIEGLEVGMFFNSLTHAVYGREISLVPVHYERLWLEWKPKRAGFVAAHAPHSITVDQTEFSKWKYEGNVISDTLIFYCFIEGKLDEGPLVYSLSGSGIKHGRNWNTQIMMIKLPSGKRAPYFSSFWKLHTTKQSNEQGSWYQIGGKQSNIERVRFIEQPDYVNIIAPIRKDLEKITSSVDYKALESGESKPTEIAYVEEDNEDVTY